MNQYDVEIPYVASEYDKGYKARLEGKSGKDSDSWSDEFYNGWADADDNIRSLKY